MQFVKIGNIANIHGIKGELKIYPYTDDLENFCKYKKIYIGEKKEEFTVLKARIHKDMILFLLDNINTPEEALRYKTYDIFIDKSQLKKLDENSYYVEDIIGLEVIDNNNLEILGIVKDVIKYPANDVYEIISGDGTFYIPAISDVIKKVDITNKKLYVELMEGLK